MTGKKASTNGAFTGQVWRLAFMLLFGLIVLEAILEAGFSTSLTGSSRGPLIKTAAEGKDIKTVNTPLKQHMRVVTRTYLHVLPSLKADKVATLAIGATLKTIAMTTVGEVDVWYQTLRFGGKIGYVHGTDVRRQ